MLETKEQKQIFAGTLVLIAILLAISFWHRPDLTVKDTAKKTSQSSDAGSEYVKSQAYLDYLKSLSTDQKASQQLFETILTKEDVKTLVESALKSDQTVSQPEISDNEIKISSGSGSQSVSQYLNDSVSAVYAFNNENLANSENLFGADAATIKQIQTNLSRLVKQLSAMEVPKDAVPLHKSLLAAYGSAYKNLLDAAAGYNSGDYSQNDAVWPEVYKNYVIANTAALSYSSELNKLESKYQISAVAITPSYAYRSPLEKFLVPEAQAFLGTSITIGDIPRIVMDSVKESLSSAFLQFMGAMLDELVQKIEKNYAISNFLYYTDALVNGQYTDDYLNKYVSDSIDREIIKKFIPQFNCGQQDENLKAIFQAKAESYLGFDPAELSTSDTDYYEKMARVGNYYSSPEGWQTYYEGLAAQAQAEAEIAAQNELSSSGLKTPRNTTTSSIAGSINSIISAEKASFSAILELGINNADNLISSTVAQLTQTLVNKFVFQGATTTSGNIAVLKEQSTCVSAAVFSPVTALASTTYAANTAVSTTQAAMAYSCSSLSTLNDDCTTAVTNELKICATNSSQHTGTQTCNDLKTSAYVTALLKECSQQIRVTTSCSNLQNYFSLIP